MGRCDYERMSALDAAFLDVENASSHMHVGAVALFGAGPLRRGDGTIDIEKIRPVREEDRQHGFDPGQLVPATRFDVDEMFAELCGIAEQHIADEPLRRLTLALLQRHEEAIKVIPAAARNHHAFRGGYLEHTLSVARLAVSLAEKYAEYYPDLNPPLSKDLVVAGAILHDIGKVRELVPTPDGGRYTAPGRLVGHIAMGRDMIRDAAREIPELDPELQLRLEHIILSHQGLPEWGSPITPHTPEALLVHYADDIDAKFHEVAMALMQAPDDDSEFTSHRNPLHRRIFRGLHTPDSLGGTSPQAESPNADAAG